MVKSPNLLHIGDSISIIASEKTLERRQRALPMCKSIKCWLASFSMVTPLVYLSVLDSVSIVATGIFEW
jgi:hypothetical protein